jgi:hypothetical protein
MHDTDMHGAAYTHICSVSTIHLDQIETHQCQRGYFVRSKPRDVERVPEKHTGPAKVVLAEVRVYGDILRRHDGSLSHHGKCRMIQSERAAFG